MKKQFIFKLFSVFIILWINWVNVAYSETISSSNNQLSRYSKTDISVQDLRKSCTASDGIDGILFCQELVKATPSDPESWNYLGYKYYNYQKYKEALLAYGQALDLNPKYSLALANMCGLLSKIKSYDLALKACDYALEKDSFWGLEGKALALDHKGNILFNLGLYQQSLNAFDSALAANPNYDNASINRSIILNHLKYFARKKMWLSSS